MRVLSPLFVLLLIAACGGSKPPPPSNSAAAPAATDGPSPSPEGGAAAASTPKPTVESQREPFIQSCLTKVKSPDYCACGFEQFREVFKDADMTQDIPANDPRLATLQQKTQAACASKLPEDQIKGVFLATCVGTEKRKAPYCDCKWPALRKNLAVADFVGDFQGPRFDEAKKAVVTACKGKFPTDVAKAEFMAGCTKDDSARGKACECIWKKLKAKYSTEDLVEGTVDPGAAIKECK
jgi:hypothetical protein